MNKCTFDLEAPGAGLNFKKCSVLTQFSYDHLIERGLSRRICRIRLTQFLVTLIELRYYVKRRPSSQNFVLEISLQILSSSLSLLAYRDRNFG